MIAALAAGVWFLLNSVAISLPSARQDLESRLTRLVGHPIQVDGQASFTMLPVPRLTLTNVRVAASGDPMAPVGNVDQIVAELDLVSALFGNVEVQRVTLVRPEFGPAKAGSPSPADDPAAESAAGGAARTSALGLRDNAAPLLESYLRRFVGIRELQVRDGLFRMPGSGTTISNASVDFAWPETDAAAVFYGSYVWNGQPTSVETQVDDPLPFLNGEMSDLRFKLDAPALQVGFTGRGTARPMLRLDGRLTLSTPSLSRALRWLDDSATSVPDLGSFSLDTRIQFIDDRVNLTEADLQLGGNEARGALEAVLPDRDGTPVLSGTLAFGRLNLATFSGAIAPPIRSVLDLQRPIHVGFVRDLDMDLRLSAAQATIGGLEVRELAAAVKSGDGVGTFDVGDMALLGGRGQMRITVDTKASAPEMRATASLRGIEASGLRAAIGDAFPISTGSSDVEFSTASGAANWGDIITGNRSELTVRARDGRIAAFDPGLLRQPGTRELTLPGSEQPFRTLVAKVRSSGTRILFEEITAALDGGTLEASGSANLRDGRVFLNGSLRSDTDESSSADQSFTSLKPDRFTMQGEWPKPVLTVVSAAKPI